jgi:hypothetical protein
MERNRLCESIAGAGEVALRAKHLGEVDQSLGVRRDVAASGHGGDCFTGERDCLLHLAATREHARAGGLPRRRVPVDVLSCLLQFGEGFVVPALRDKDVRNAGAVEGDVPRCAHVLRHLDRIA